VRVCSDRGNSNTVLSHAYFVHKFQSRRRGEYGADTRPPGTSVTVYYDPATLRRSVLDRAEDSPTGWLIPCLSGIRIGSGIYIALVLTERVKIGESGETVREPH
jgi:hypothetical protein